MRKTVGQASNGPHKISGKSANWILSKTWLDYLRIRSKDYRNESEYVRNFHLQAHNRGGTVSDISHYNFECVNVKLLNLMLYSPDRNTLSPSLNTL
jgi:hypothetical protein